MNNPCNHCQRKGLAIFPALYAAVPNEAAKGLPALTGMFGKGVTDKALTENIYALRGMEPGYLYLLYPNKVWKGYLIDAAGYPRYYPDLALEDMPNKVPDKSDVVACAQQGKNHSGVEAICIEFPELIKGPVYLKYSRHKWTRKVRIEIAKNAAQHGMQQIMSLDGTPFEHAEVASAENLRKWVIDFDAAAVVWVNKHLPEGGEVRDRSTKAEDIAQAMLRFSGELKVPGLIMALHDAAGITMATNNRRNRLVAEAAAAAGLGDEQRARKRVVAVIIEGMRLNAQAEPGPFWDRNYGPERYLKHIDESAWKAALKEAQDVKALQSRIKAASADYVQWKESEGWKSIQAHEFDTSDDASALAHEKMVAASVAGSGLTQDEREKVWNAVLKLPGASQDHWLYRALSALNPGFQAHIAAEKKYDKEYDGLKVATGLAKEWTSEEAVPQLAKFYAELRAKRQASEATAALIESTAALLFRIRSDNPQAFNKLVRAVASTLITRADVVPQPVAVKGTASRVAAFIHQIAKVREVPQGAAPVILKPVAGVPGARKGNFGTKAWELADAVGAEVVFKAPNSQEETKTTVAWVLRKLNSGAQLNDKLMKTLGLAHVDLTVPAPKMNPFLENHIMRLGAKVDFGLSAGTTLFQVYAFSNALETYNKGGTGNQVDGGVGMITAVVSATGGLVEIAAAVQVLRAQKVAAARLMRVAGGFGIAAGVIEGAYLIGKGIYKATATADTDSAYWTIRSGVFVALGGFATYGAAAAGASGLLGGAGTMLGIGPVGWACLTLALLGAAVYCGWQAWATDDNNLLPVEYWLDNGSFGKRKFVSGGAAVNSPYLSVDKTVKPFASLDDEMRALQQVVLVAQVRMWAARDRGGFSLMCFYDVALPRYEVGTRLEVVFTAINEGQRLEVGRVVCENGAAKPAQSYIEPRLTGKRDGPKLTLDAKSATLRLEGYFSTMRDPTIVNKAFDRFGWQKDNNVYADNFEMQVNYWPDKINLADLSSNRKARV